VIQAPSSIRFILLAFVGILITDIPPACSHRDRMKDIDHLAFIESATNFINIEVVLHFHEIPSEQTRKGQMDTNGDGTISSTELDQYYSALDKKLLHRFTLKVDGKPIPLVSLYRPEADLLGNNRVQQTPHLLKIFLTATLPVGISSMALFQFEDRSFSSIPGQSRMEVRDTYRESRVYRTSFTRRITFHQPAVRKDTGYLFHPNASVSTIKEEYHEDPSP